MLRLAISVGVAVSLSCAPAGTDASDVATQVVAVAQPGDIVLHRSRSSQAEALRAATGSPYTHVGLLFSHEDEYHVLEAVEPVRWTALDEWIDRGDGERIVVLRLPGLSDADVEAVRAAAENFLGRHYDLLFEWGDDRIYCSELVFKAFQQGAGREVGVLQTFADLDLSSPQVRALIDARADGQIDTSELVVTPVSILNDEELVVVFDNDPDRRSE